APRRLAGQRVRGQHLDRDVPLQLLVARAVDHAHPARADLLQDPERTDDSADQRLTTGVGPRGPWMSGVRNGNRRHTTLPPGTGRRNAGGGMSDWRGAMAPEARRAPLISPTPPPRAA